MKQATRLEPEALRILCDPGQFSFQTTAELPDISLLVGQTRATDAMQFGLRMPGDGYNIFALGPPGIGKQTAVRLMVDEEARQGAAPDDWCYVYNFEHPHKPNAIQLPAGEGAWLRGEMEQLVENLKLAMPAAFESEDYRARSEELDQALKDKQREATQKVADEAKKKHIALINTANGFAFAPMNEAEEVLSPEAFQKLPEADRKRIEADVREAQEALQKALRQLPQWIKSTREAMRAVNREISQSVVEQLITELKTHFASNRELTGYLNAVQGDIVENVEAFLPQPEGPMAFMAQSRRGDQLQRYAVNLLVDNKGLDSAPIVFEDLPSYANLLGRTEYQAQMGTLVTDFTLIRPGALHRANGGYLVLDARQVLMQPLAWDGLKRAMQAREIRLDSLERSLSLISTVSLEPEHIPLSVKVVLVGDRQLYYLLSQFDPDFNDLFKVMADFDEVMDRGPDGDTLYAGLFATLARQNNLRALDRGGVARMIEHASRIADDSEKTSTHLGAMTDVLREADHWAHEADRPVIEAADVQRAVDQLTYRAGRVRARIYESIRRGTIMIDTDGEQIGQVNGLSVLQLGQVRFGQPSRITATTRLGDGKIIDIERETELGGALHSKGVLILSGFLASRYSSELPLSLSASLVFEQSYGQVDGDSASMAELCALLSSLSQRGISQSFAITGSVNQHGKAQPIGGVNEKIEGFFDVCSSIGLTGKQGVIIPQSNVKHLMLRDDVVEAVRQGRFAIHSVTTVDEAVALLTGSEAGEKDANGHYPADSINGLVQARLEALADIRVRFAQKRESGKGEADKNE